MVPLPDDPDHLLLGGGTATTVQQLDLQRLQWRSAGITSASRDGICHLLPFRQAGRLWLWESQRGMPQYGNGVCGVSDDLWSLQPLYAAADTAAASLMASGDGYAFDRAVTAFVPLQGERPALLVGGSAGEFAQTQSAAVDAVFPDGRVAAYPPLVLARAGAFAARIGGGVLVWGGSDGASNQRDDQRRVLPVEWLDESLPPAERAWQVLPTPALQIVALGPDADGRLLALGARGEVLRVTLQREAGGFPRLHVERLRELPVRHAPDSPGQRQVGIRGLADGRIVVAGGNAPTLRIARWQPDEVDPAQPDEYLGFGPFGPASTYLVFDPATGRWHESAAAGTAGGRVAIGESGAVFKLAAELIPAPVDAAGVETGNARWAARTERSAADGRGWTPLALDPIAGMPLGNASLAVPFLIDETLLLAVEGDVPIGGRPSVVLRVDGDGTSAQVLWRASAGDNWRKHVGRLVHRVAADGRPIVFPVDGE